MTTNESACQSQLSTDLEMLHARVKGKSLTLEELKQLKIVFSMARRAQESQSPHHDLLTFGLRNNPHRFYKLDNHEIH